VQFIYITKYKVSIIYIQDKNIQLVSTNTFIGLFILVSYVSYLFRNVKYFYAFSEITILKTALQLSISSFGIAPGSILGLKTDARFYTKPQWIRKSNDKRWKQRLFCHLTWSPRNWNTPERIVNQSGNSTDHGNYDHAMIHRSSSIGSETLIYRWLVVRWEYNRAKCFASEMSNFECEDIW
jgi:hypothetical protein